MGAIQYTTLDLETLQQIEDISDYKAKVYNAAMLYAAAGYYVIPVVKNGKGIPPKKHNVNYGHAARNKKTIEKWYNPDTGVFAGWNIGIATGRHDGVFVMDVDKHGEDNGFDTLDRILDEEGEVMPSGPVQLTPNGGKHYLFGWQKDAASSTGKIGPGVDTRGGLVDACKGHIVVFPSTIKGIQYEWESGGPLPTIPMWLMVSLGKVWHQPTRGTGRGNEAVTDADLEDNVPLGQVTRMLTAVNPDEVTYDEWLKLGMAIKSQHPDEGLDIWDEWSSHGERYKPDECKIRWDGFADDGTVRMATLFYFAKQHGHALEPTDKKPNRLGMVTERMNEYHAVVVTGNKFRILREMGGEIEKMTDPFQLLTRADFKALYENDTICTNPEKGKFVSVADIWMADPNRREYSKGMGMYPDGAPEGYYNTWNGFDVEPVEGNCSLFKAHILNMICNGDEDLNMYVLDWCADLFQHPSDPKGTAIVLRGQEGTGKGTFADTIGMMCSPHYTHLTDEAHLTGQFNSHMSNSLIVFADEITWGGNRQTAGKLKGLVTEKYLMLERKGIDAISQRNMVHVIVASNSDWVVPAGANSRRWLVLDVSIENRSNEKYFKPIYKELSNGGTEAFLYEMLNRKIECALTLAPETEALEEQRSMVTGQEDNIMRWWIRILVSGKMVCDDLDEADNVGWPKQVSKVDFYDEYEEYCDRKKINAIPSNPFFKKMVKFGFVNLKKRVPGGRMTVYTVPAHKTAVRKVEMLTGLKLETIDYEKV